MTPPSTNPTNPSGNNDRDKNCFGQFYGRRNQRYDHCDVGRRQSVVGLHASTTFQNIQVVGESIPDTVRVVERKMSCECWIHIRFIQ